jgi:predicted ATPase
VKPCECREPHERKRIVLTGGPGGGKTAVLELIRLNFCEHVRVLPEAAGIVFGGGFPRGQSVGQRQAAQRAIFHVQRELEAAADAEAPAIVLCDRGTIDGAAYWIGDGDLWSTVSTTLEKELRRYDAVIHLRSPGTNNGYNHQNPLRIESAESAAALDRAILSLWESHPHRYVVEASANFLLKAREALEVLRAQLPECCRNHVIAWNQNHLT